MVSISDIVGAMLRGLTVSRIRSDIFSSDAANQYLQDSNLQSYPVPRVEIRQATIDMKFGVVETVRRNIDVLSLTYQKLLLGLPDYANAVFQIPAKATSGDPIEAYQPLAAHLGDQADAIASELIDALDIYLESNLQIVYDGLLNSPFQFGSQTLRPETLTALTTILANRGITVWLDDTNFKKDLKAVAIAWAEEMNNVVALAINIAETEFFELDLGVKKDQLIDVPEHAMSKLDIVMVIQNYEWTLTQDEEGNTIKKLTRL